MSSGRVKAARAAKRKAAAKIEKRTPKPPTSIIGGTMSGAAIEAIRPKLAAAPVPLPRKDVGYSSGPMA